MAADLGNLAVGYLNVMLSDGVRPFRFRSRLRALLGLPEDVGIKINFARPLTKGRFIYARRRIFGEFDLTDKFLTESRHASPTTRGPSYTIEELMDNPSASSPEFLRSIALTGAAVNLRPAPDPVLPGVQTPGLADLPLAGIEPALAGTHSLTESLRYSDMPAKAPTSDSTPCERDQLIPGITKLHDFPTPNSRGPMSVARPAAAIGPGKLPQTPEEAPTDLASQLAQRNLGVKSKPGPLGLSQLGYTTEFQIGSVGQPIAEIIGSKISIESKSFLRSDGWSTGVADRPHPKSELSPVGGPSYLPETTLEPRPIVPRIGWQEIEAIPYEETILPREIPESPKRTKPHSDIKRRGKVVPTASLLQPGSISQSSPWKVPATPSEEKRAISISRSYSSEPSRRQIVTRSQSISQATLDHSPVTLEQTPQVIVVTSSAGPAPTPAAFWERRHLKRYRARILR